MTAARLAECLEQIHWSARQLARMIGVDERQIRRWLSGRGTVPGSVARWLDGLARYHEAHPAPQRE